MNFCSTLLKKIYPKKKILSAIRKEYPRYLKSNTPIPKKTYLKDSIIADIGFPRIIHLYFSGIIERGKITVEAYIINRTPNPIRNRKSLYFAVEAENNSPNPNPIMAIIKMSIGNTQSN
jgi:hypothetical protein